MTARFDSYCFQCSSASAAAVICRTEHGNLHLGIYFKEPGGSASILHLGWEDTLKMNDWNWDRLWASPNTLPEFLDSAAGYCRLVWSEFKKSRSFPYALAFHGTSFDAQGRLVLGNGARGLTCATLVLAIFKAAQVDLVDENSWPTRTEEDREFLEFVRKFATRRHFSILEQEVDAGAKRIQPAEVVAACELDQRLLPATFNNVAPGAGRIKSLL